MSAKDMLQDLRSKLAEEEKLLLELQSRPREPREPSQQAIVVTPQPPEQSKAAKHTFHSEGRVAPTAQHQQPCGVQFVRKSEEERGQEEQCSQQQPDGGDPDDPPTPGYVPVPYDPLGIALSFWGAQRFDPKDSSNYPYHALASGRDPHARWASAIATAYELWEGPESVLGSTTWYYHGEGLDPLFLASVAYDPLRPLRLRISTHIGLGLRLPRDYGGTFIIECRPFQTALESLACQFPNTSGIFIGREEDPVSAHDVFPHLSRFRHLREVKMMLTAPTEPVYAPPCPSVRVLRCYLDSNWLYRPHHHLTDAIASVFPNLEELAYNATKWYSSDTKVAEVLAFTQLKHLKVLKLDRSFSGEVVCQAIRALEKELPGLSVGIPKRHYLWDAFPEFTPTKLLYVV